jgi:hypothetical protein
MYKVIQGLLDNVRVYVTRNLLTYIPRKYAKPAISSVEEARHPLSVIDVNFNQEQSNISSLHVVDGVKSLPEMNSMKKTGHPKGCTKANTIKDNKQKVHCVAEIAKVYNQKMNEVKATGLQK